MTMAIRSETILVTPELALMWLACNPMNRSVSLAAVKAMARDMADGRWALNGESIIIDRDGNLLDGQHRLHAIVDSKSAIRMVVTRGVDPDVFGTIGGGRRRSQSDVLAISGFKNTGAVAATARLITWYRNFYPAFSVFRMTNAEVVDMLDHEPHLADHVGKLCSLAGLRTIRAGSHFHAVTYLANMISPDITELFIDGVARGENLNRGDGRLAFREWMLNRPMRRMAKSEMPFLVAVKAWNAFSENRSIGVLRVTYSETYPRLKGSEGLGTAPPARKPDERAQRASNGLLEAS